MSQFPSPRLTRLSLLVLVPIAVVLAIQAVVWAASLKTWSSGDTLTAGDLNNNFAGVAPFLGQDNAPGSSQSITSTTYADFNTAFPDWTVSVPSDGEYLLWFTGSFYAPASGETIVSIAIKVDSIIPTGMIEQTVDLQNTTASKVTLPYKVSLTAGSHTFRVVTKLVLNTSVQAGGITRTFTLTR